MFFFYTTKTPFWPNVLVKVLFKLIAFKTEYILWDLKSSNITHNKQVKKNVYFSNTTFNNIKRKLQYKLAKSKI